jgi:AcrR family transcriptional regulator
MGRPDALTRARIRRVVEAARTGCNRSLQARAAGVSPATLYRWLAEGREPGAKGLRRELFLALERAEADGAKELLEQIREAATGGTWQAAAWLLERRHGYNRSGAASTLREHGELDALANLDEIEALRRQLREVERANQLSLESGSFQAYVAGQRLARQLWADLAVALGAERHDPVEDLDSEQFRAELREAMQGWPDQLLELSIRVYEQRHALRLLGVAEGGRST